MNISVRSCVAAGVAVTTAATIALAPPMKESVHAVPTVRVVPAALHLTGQQVQPFAGAAAASPADVLASIVQHYLVPANASTPFPTPQFPPVVAGNSLGSTIKNVYNRVEPWVQWGFEIAEWAVDWIPWVGWLAPQVMIFYHFGERIVRSITFNIADWIDHAITFREGLRNVAVDTVNSFIQLGYDEWDFFFWFLPPLPPLPTAADPATAELTMAMSAEESIGKSPTEDGKVDETVDETQGVVLSDVLSEDVAVSEIEETPAETVAEQDGSPVEPTDESLTNDVETVTNDDETVTDDEETVAKDDSKLDAEPTTSSSGTVQAQGEVRESGLSNQQPEATKVSLKDTADTREKPETAAGAPETTASTVSKSDETANSHQAGNDTKDDAGKE